MAIKSKDFRFFRDNAGYCVGQRAVGAIALARAEQEAQERDWEFVWEWDEGGADTLGDHAYWCADERRERAGRGFDGEELSARYFERNGHEHEILWCSLRDVPTGEYLASLGGIIDPSNEYRRVIEAELASEALSYERDQAEKTLAFVGRAFGVAVAS